MKKLLILFLVSGLHGMTPNHPSYSHYRHSPNTNHRTLNMPPPLSLPAPSPMSPEEVHVIEIQTHAQEVQDISKKKIACLVAATAITSAILTATVTLTVHFTECSK